MAGGSTGLARRPRRNALAAARLIARDSRHIARPAQLAELGVEPIAHVTPHGLRRTYASLRHAVGDDPAYTAAQIGHVDPAFTLRVDVQETKRRERLTEAERREYDRAVDWTQWAQMGTNKEGIPSSVAVSENHQHRNRAAEAGSSEWSVPGSNR
jgi:hypothetical protein